QLLPLLLLLLLTAVSHEPAAVMLCRAKPVSLAVQGHRGGPHREDVRVSVPDGDPRPLPQTEHDPQVPHSLLQRASGTGLCKQANGLFLSRILFPSLFPPGKDKPQEKKEQEKDRQSQQEAGPHGSTLRGQIGIPARDIGRIRVVKTFPGWSRVPSSRDSEAP